jgi:tripartite-type tricarboxylate transporter receptor subunit TctC
MTMKKPGWKLLSCLGLVFAFLLLTREASAQADFYKNKTLTIIQARSPGGTGDMRVRAIIPFLQKYIPGNPVIVSEYMPGGGGRKGTNYIYRSARPDGLTIGNVGTGLIANAVLETTGIEYDLAKLIYLGSPYSAYHSLFLSRKEAGLHSREKLREISGVRIGAQAVGHATYLEGRLFAFILGMKEPRFVTGYSGPELDAALVRGEIDARSSSIETILGRTRDWLERNLMDFHAIFEVPKGNKHPDVRNIPELETFAASDAERRLLTLERAFKIAGAPFILPPGTPRARVQILQEAMRRTFRDPQFREEFRKLVGEDATPLMPEALEQVIRELPRDPETAELAKNLAGPEPLPPRPR